MTFTKKDNFTLIVNKTEVVTSSKEYNLGFLLKQKENIQAQKERDNAQRDLELSEVNTLILEAGKLGIIAEEVLIKKLAI